MSDAIPILHMFSPQKHMSPFDVNMAADAGYKVIVPYINVTLEEVTGLTQDAIFSRPPDSGVRTGIFIGGKDALLALDMMDAAKKALDEFDAKYQAELKANPNGPTMGDEHKKQRAELARNSIHLSEELKLTNDLGELGYGIHGAFFTMAS